MKDKWDLMSVEKTLSPAESIIERGKWRRYLATDIS